MGKSGSKKYAILIIAAGTSKRLGRPKQLVKVEGEYLLQSTLNSATKVENADTYIILGAYADEILESIQFSVPVYINPDWELGMGRSIAFGVRHIIDHYYDAVILSVCDQPFLNSTHIDQLISLYEANSNNEIIISKYQSGNGPPTLFSKKYFCQLSNIDGDDGAKEIVKKNKEIVQYVDFQKGDIDIDTDEDLKNFRVIL